MKKEKKGNSFIKKPYYEGGMKAMKTFIGQNLTYPQAAKEAKIEGTVHIRYTINYQGKVVAIKIISGIGYGCDAEAKRLVEQLKFVVPRNRKLKALFHKNIQIHFRLPKNVSKEIQTPPNPDSPIIKYNYQPKEQAEKGKDSGYSYTINL